MPHGVASLPFVLSTHDLTQRSTPAAALCCITRKPFNSRPHAEVDPWWTLPTFWGRLSTHDLTQRSTYTVDHNEGSGVFQLTTSRRGRLIPAAAGRRRTIFQLTTSRRGRPAVTCKPPGKRPFNSRPHAEVDRKRQYNGCSFTTFQLTTSRRGRQLLGMGIRYAACLSTHDLTQRSTLHSKTAKKPSGSFNSRPHAEVDAVGGFENIVHEAFQLTTSRRGRQSYGRRLQRN